jgi:hypothetical protein
VICTFNSEILSLISSNWQFLKGGRIAAVKFDGRGTITNALESLIAFSHWKAFSFNWVRNSDTLG